MAESLKFSVTSPQQILNNPANNSISKYHYSFSKSPRFANLQPVCPQSYYESPRSKTRAAGIGYGKKFEFTRLPTQPNPEPTKYNIQSMFDSNKLKNKGRSFGLSREQQKDQSYIIQEPLKVPGPGQYPQKRALSNKTKMYSMRMKMEDLHLPPFLYQKHESFKPPGPGKYETVALFSPKKSSLSTYQNERMSLIGTKEQRFFNASTNSPGPGRYDYVINMNPNAKYPVSNFQGQGKRLIGHELRKTFIDNARNFSAEVPSPGSYRLQSDFGHYDKLEQEKQKQGK